MMTQPAEPFGPEAQVEAAPDHVANHVNDKRIVHVVDDDEAVRRAVAMLLKSAGMPAETHATGRAFLQAFLTLDETNIRCVLTDIRMPEVSGLDLLHSLKTRGFRQPVIVMTAHGEVSTAVQAMKMGAADFIEKPFDGKALLTLIEATRSVSAETAAGIDPAPDSAVARVAALSPREREVLNLLMEGKSTKIVARELAISPRTVEIHRARLMTRLEVSSLAEAVRLAVLAEMK
jgi:two-component system, LuxR family, response regulator FixJ